MMQQNSENHVNFHLFFVWHIHAENGNSMNSTHSMNDVIINEFIKIPKMTSPYPFTSMIYPKLNSRKSRVLIRKYQTIQKSSK